MNAIGLGFGPLVFGALSDAFHTGFTLLGWTMPPSDDGTNLRFALSIGAVFSFVSIALYLCAARFARREIGLATKHQM